MQVAKTSVLLVGVLLVIANAHQSQGANLFEADVLDEKAAPWWEQQEEVARAKCRSSCTANSKGVRTRLSLCDDKDVSIFSVVSYQLNTLPFAYILPKSVR